MIFFRNQLLYFSIPYDKDVLKFMAESIKPKGMFFIGGKEKIEDPDKIQLELIDKNERIYLKR